MPPGQQRHRRASTQRGGYNIYEIGSKKTVRNFHGVQHGSLLDFGVAEDLAISDVARVFGLRTSAIRYYEQIGILPQPMRKNGQRRYDNSALFRLAVVQRAERWGSRWRKYASSFSGSRPGRLHRNAGTNCRNVKSRNFRNG